MALKFPPKGQCPNREETLALLRACDRNREYINEWNAYRRYNRDWKPDLYGTREPADLRGLSFGYPDDSEAWIRIDLSLAYLFGANLEDANLEDANLTRANLGRANLGRANLGRANLEEASLRGANLRGANLRTASLALSTLNGANLVEADLDGARISGTGLGGVDLSQAKNLDTVNHQGPSTIGTDTLERSRGRIPETFLLGCGLKPWEILGARLYDPDLTPEEINDIQYKIFEARTSGPLVLGGVFISYSHADAGFVDKVRGKLVDKGVSVWLDRHELVAGPLQKQIDKAIGLNNVVLLVLSEDAIASEWVKKEVKAARRIERKEDRDVLCPVALDDAWKEKRHDKKWKHIPDKHILDFSKWKTKAFAGQFAKLLKGLKIYYTRGEEKDREDAS